jgi:hypothetical protein
LLTVNARLPPHPAVPGVVAESAAASAAANVVKQLEIDPLFIVGTTLLIWVITCELVVVWPAQSVADQVRVINCEQLETGFGGTWL